MFKDGKPVSNRRRGIHRINGKTTTTAHFKNAAARRRAELRGQILPEDVKAVAIKHTTFAEPLARGGWFLPGLVP